MTNRACSVAVAALLATVACGEDTIIYPGGPAGAITGLDLSAGRVVVPVGSSVTVGAVGRDAAGNPTADAVSFTACSALVTAATGAAEGPWAATATIAAAGLGETCVVASAGGVTDTIRVATAPVSIRIVGPDTVLSGTAGTFTIEYFGPGGAPLTPDASFQHPAIQSLDTKVAFTDSTGPSTTDVSGALPGNVTLQVEVSDIRGALTARSPLTVVPGVFAGTRSLETQASQQAVVLKPAAGRAWDGDERVLLNGIPLNSWDGTLANPPIATPESLVVYVPVTMASGTYDTMLVVSQGPTQIAEQLIQPFVVVAAATTSNQQGFPGTNTDGASIEDKTLPLYFPVVHPDPGVTRNSYYTVAPSSDNLIFTILLEINGGADVDIQFIDGGFTAFLGDRSGETLAAPEATVWGVEAGDFNFIRFQNFESFATSSDVRIYAGCVAGITNGDGEAVEDTDNWGDWC